MDSADRKAWMRQEAMTCAAKLSEEYKAQSSARIMEQVMALPAYRTARTIFCFVGRKNEVHTKELIAHALSEGKRVGVPLVVCQGIMEAKEIHSLDDLKEGRMRILEPDPASVTIAPNEIDLAIIPCVSCSHEGARLGFGGGYYDRYLMQADFTVACVCYEVLTRDAIPLEPHDCKMDLLITETGTFAIGNVGRI